MNMLVAVLVLNSGTRIAQFVITATMHMLSPLQNDCSSTDFAAH